MSSIEDCAQTRPRRFKPWSLACVLMVGVSACSLAPDHRRPPLPTPQSYPVASAEGASIARIGWREVFREPELQRLIDTALANSRDIRIAAARVAEARAAWRCPPSAPMRQIEGSV